MKTRNTIQKTLIKQAVQNLKIHPSADEIYEEIIKTTPTVSKATVYRNLSMLAENGDILKIEVPNAPDRFDFNTEKHTHIKCERCGRVFDIKMPYFDILDRVADENFTINGYNLIFKGICKTCEEEQLNG